MADVSTTEEIVANADYHSKLLKSLSEVEYAPSAIKQHERYMKELEAQLEGSNKRIEALARATTKERKEHEKLRDSTARRFAAKLSGRLEKFEANQVKEEREYVEALQKEMIERESNTMVQKLLDDARVAREDLAAKGINYDALRAEIELLYSRIFDGPSESFPVEDNLEYDVHEAYKEYENTQSQLNVESQAAELLARAVVQMGKCCKNVKDALDFSSMDMWSTGPGPTFGDIYERDALAKASGDAYQVKALVEQAQRLNPKIKPIGSVNIPSGSYLMDVWLDSTYTSVSFHYQIEECAAQIKVANSKLKQERDAALKRADVAGQNLLLTSQRLDDLRKELHNLRKALFESVVSHTPKPPSYDNATAEPLPLSPKEGPPMYQSGSSSHKPDSFPSPLLGSAGALSSGVTTSGRTVSPDLATSPQFASQSNSPRPWGDRNPYAALLAKSTRSMSSDTP